MCWSISKFFLTHGQTLCLHHHMLAPIKLQKVALVWIYRMAPRAANVRLKQPMQYCMPVLSALQYAVLFLCCLFSSVALLKLDIQHKQQRDHLGRINQQLWFSWFSLTFLREFNWCGLLVNRQFTFVACCQQYNTPPSITGHYRACCCEGHGWTNNIWDTTSCPSFPFLSLLFVLWIYVEVVACLI